jgi:hypothetical protein
VNGLDIPFRLPVKGWPRAVFRTDHTYAGGELVVDGRTVLRVADRNALTAGCRTEFHDQGDVEVVLHMDGSVPDLKLFVAGEPAVREDRTRVRPSRSAWVHAFFALAASAAGFAASWLYLERSEVEQSAHAFKMAYHMAGWHLLLTFSLFPASVWGQRAGIRAVQAVSLVFFGIHAFIAAANVIEIRSMSTNDLWIATWNAVSGVFFLAAVFYGNTAHRDMNPARAFTDEPAEGATLCVPQGGSL